MASESNLHVEMVGLLFVTLIERGLLTGDHAARLVNEVLSQNSKDSEAYASYQVLAHDLLIYPGEMEDQER